MNDAVWIDSVRPTGPIPEPDAAGLQRTLGGHCHTFAGRNRRISSNEQPNWNDAIWT